MVGGSKNKGPQTKKGHDIVRWHESFFVLSEVPSSRRGTKSKDLLNIDSFYTRREDGHLSFEKYLRGQIESEDSQILVAVDEGDVVAYSLVRIGKYPPVFELQSYGEIIDVAVKSTHRRKGIGTKMLSRIYEWFKSRAVNRIELWVAAGNEIGYSF